MENESIKYEGIVVLNGFYYLVLSNNNNKINIPMQEKEAKRIALWIDKLSPAKTIPSFLNVEE